MPGTAADARDVVDLGLDDEPARLAVVCVIAVATTMLGVRRREEREHSAGTP